MMNEVERAYKDGQVDARLDNHDAHLASINGSIIRTGDTLLTLVGSVEALTAQVAIMVSALGRYDELLVERKASEVVVGRKRIKLTKKQVAYSLGFAAVTTILNMMTLGPDLF